MAQTQRQTRAESELYVYWKTLGSVSGNKSVHIDHNDKAHVTHTRASEGHPCPGEVLHGDLLLAPHGAVVAGSRGGRDGVRQQADTELAPQSAKYKYCDLKTTMKRTLRSFVTFWVSDSGSPHPPQLVCSLLDSHHPRPLGNDDQSQICQLPSPTHPDLISFFYVFLCFLAS